MTTPPTTFRITAYYKRKRNEPGLTQLGSQRINIGQALDFLLAELPDDAWQIFHPDNSGERVTIAIDWSKVPAEIRTGAAR